MESVNAGFGERKTSVGKLNLLFGKAKGNVVQKMTKYWGGLKEMLHLFVLNGKLHLPSLRNAIVNNAKSAENAALRALARSVLFFAVLRVGARDCALCATQILLDFVPHLW